MRTGPRTEHGLGHLHELDGRWYGRWRSPAGKNRNRAVGSVRVRGSREGLSRAEARKKLTAMIAQDAGAPVNADDRPTINELGDALYDGPTANVHGPCAPASRVPRTAPPRRVAARLGGRRRRLRPRRRGRRPRSRGLAARPFARPDVKASSEGACRRIRYVSAQRTLAGMGRSGGRCSRARGLSSVNAKSTMATAMAICEPTQEIPGTPAFFLVDVPKFERLLVKATCGSG